MIMNKRQISENFLKRLQANGDLHEIVDCVKNDPQLVMFLRGKYVTVYYKTLQILKILPQSAPIVNGNYFGYKGVKNYPISLTDFGGNWKGYFEKAKVFLDNYNRGNLGEKVTQQKLVCDNKEKDTDYQVFDVEYTQDGKTRFDALAVYMTDQKNLGLAFIELKEGYTSVGGGDNDSGIKGHYKKAVDFIELYYNTDFLTDMQKVVEQLSHLGLLKFGKDINFSPEIKPEYIFAMSHYPFKSGSLMRQLKDVIERKDLLISNFVFLEDDDRLFRKDMILLENVYDYLQKKSCK